MESYEITALAQRIEQAIGTEDGNDGEALDALREMSDALGKPAATLRGSVPPSMTLSLL